MGKLEENGKQRKSCMSKRVCVYTNERKCTYENIFRLKNQHYKSEVERVVSRVERITALKCCMNNRNVIYCFSQI